MAATAVGRIVLGNSSRSLRAFATASGGKLKVGVVGAMGVVGTEMIKCLEQTDFPLSTLRLFEGRDIGKEVKTAFGTSKLEALSAEAARECDVVLLAVGDDISKEFAPQIAGGPNKTVVIDNSAAFRMQDDVPLVVPEINGELISGAGIISNPNCTTSIGAMVLWPLHQKYGIKRVLMSTYQSASGAGEAGMNEVISDAHAFVKDGAVPPPKAFAHQLLFNVIPHIDAFQANGYTREEMKVAWEMVKIFRCDIKVACTAVRVPTIRAHGESITIETEKPIDPTEAREILRGASGVRVVDDPDAKAYPMPLNASGKFDVEVGRIRQSLAFGANGLEMFVVGDQLLRGAALNAVLIAKHVAKERIGA